MKLHTLLFVVHSTRVTDQNASELAKQLCQPLSHDLLNREGDRNTWKEIRTTGMSFLPIFSCIKTDLPRAFRHPEIYRSERKLRQPPQQHDVARSLNHCHRILFTWCGRVGLFPFAGGLHFSGSKAEKDTPSANTPATSRTPLGRNDEDRRHWRPVTTYAFLLSASFLSHALAPRVRDRELREK